MNHVILVGRIANEPEVVKYEDDKARTIINLAISRPFKNSEGIYETDFIRCVMWNGLAERTKEYCKKGDIICVRGRLQERNYEKENGEKVYISEVIAENISFVSSVNRNNKETEREER